MREHISVFPHCSIQDISELLTALLDEKRWRVISRTSHPSDALFPALTRMLDEHPGARAFVCHDIIPTGAYDPAAVLRHFSAAPAEWDPLLIRALSQSSGGWAYGMLADRQRLEFGVAAFYAGRTLEAELHSGGHEQLQWRATDRALDEEATRATFARYHQWIARGDARDLRWGAEGEVRCWLACPPLEPDDDIEGLVADMLFRSVFVGTSRAEVQRALSTVAPAVDATIVERASTVMQTPFTIADGQLQAEHVIAAARLLRCAAVHIELGSLSGTFFWTEVTAEGSVRGDKGRGALALATVLGAAAQALGEPAAAIR